MLEREAVLDSAESALRDLSVIIVSTNEAHWVRQCLPTILEHAGNLDLDVIVVDNESTDGGPALIETEFPWARVVPSKNRGFAHANNRGVMSANARYVLFLNPDTEILEGTFEDLVRFMDAHPSVGLLGVKQRTADRELVPTIRRFPTPWRAFWEALGSERFPFHGRWLGERELRMAVYEQEQLCDWTSGSFMLARREALESGGLMDERFFIYSEEPDLSLRMKQAGWETRHVPSMTILHHFDKAGVSPKLQAQDALARIQYAQKHFSVGRRIGYRIALFIRYALRLALALLPRGDRELRAKRRAAFRWALSILFGRGELPFGDPPDQAVQIREPSKTIRP